MKRRPAVYASIILAAALATPAFSSNSERDTDRIGDRDVGKGVNFYSIEKEIAMGRRMAQDVERDSKLLDDPAIGAYVNRIGQNLVRNSDAKVPFTIKVIDSSDVNAFAFPGGFFFVYSGLILEADNEAELAGVMAHEIAHVAARHGTRQLTRGELVDYGTIPLIFLGGWTGYAIRQAAGLAVPMGFLKFSRGMESEADLLGLEYAYKAGYDPRAFVDFFEKIQTLEKKKPGTMSRMFSTHPMTGDRIRAAQQEIQHDLKPQPQYIVDTSEFQNVKSRLETIKNRHKRENKGADEKHPRLKRRTGAGKVDTANTENGPADGADSDDSGRPTLKRHD
jgi:predicted Zn-dependent protease